MNSALAPYAATLAQLTENAVITLRRNADGLVFLRDTYTGSGKWTHLAMLGVRNNLRKAGCIEGHGTLDRLTPLGIALATAIDADPNGALDMCRKT